MVAPATPPPPLAEGDGGGGETNRWCSDALNSVASRTLTTHSSPLDVSDEEINDYPHSKSKVVDDATSGDYYQSVETPRSIVTGGGASASVHSIQIQIDSIHPTPSAEVTPQASVTASSSRRRRRGDRRDPTTTTKRPVSFQRKCRTLCLQTLIIAGPPAVVLVFLRLSLTYVVLVILNVVMAFAAWEWNWWSYRIRRRLLLPFQPVPTNEPSTNTTQSMEDLQDAVLNERVIAVQKFTKGRNPWAKYFIAGVIAMVVCGVSIPLIDMCSDSIITKRSSDVGKNVLFSSVVTGVFSGVFCACLTATPADAIILCVYEACFVVSSLNSFLSHHEHLVHDPELLDSMYLLLVGACTIVVWRIVSSKDVMESTLMAMTDILGLGYLVAPMMALSDILGYPNVRYRNDVVGTFFVVVSAAEAAYHLNTLLKNNFPRFLQRWRRPVAKLVSTTLGYESLLLSIVFGVIGSIISMLCFHGYIIHWQDALLYLGAILVSQFCRLALDAMKVMAKADAVKYQPWLSGYMDLVNPYVLAMIVFHPYVKSLVKR